MRGITDADLLGITGCAVVGGGGETIGKLTDVRLDDASGLAEWGVVKTGMFGGGSKVIPLVTAERRGDDVFVPFDKATIKDAPPVRDPAFISEAEEMRLYTHYGVAFSEAPTDPSAHGHAPLPRPPAPGGPAMPAAPETGLGHLPVSGYTRDGLYRRARELDIAGRSSMSKQDLYEAVTAAGG